MYSICDYGAMIADKGRMEPYVTALKNTVDNNSVVMDIGTGTGVFALLACHFGARHVYAVEPNDAIQVGRELAAINGFSEKITFIQDLSTKVTLPEKANIVISDMRGMLPLCGQHFSSIIDARQRHLAKSGVLIPLQDTIRVALAEAADLYQRYSSPWASNEYGIDMQAPLQRVRNTMWTDNVGERGSERIVGNPVTWVTIDYRTIDSPNVSGEIKWQLDQKADIHGIRVWFDTELVKGVNFSNAPDKATLIYGSTFLPLLESVSLNQGD